MKLLFDENLSPRLSGSLVEDFPDSLHVRHVGLPSADDEAIWSYAKEHGFAIVTKDEEFHQRSFVRGAPPKVVWVRRGNCSTDEIVGLLRGHSNDIVQFGEDPEAALLTLD